MNKKTAPGKARKMGNETGKCLEPCRYMVNVEYRIAVS